MKQTYEYRKIYILKRLQWVDCQKSILFNIILYYSVIYQSSLITINAEIIILTFIKFNFIFIQRFIKP